jgi:hypothetical protein
LAGFQNVRTTPQTPDRFAGDDVVGQPHDLLLVAFVADFGSAEMIVNSGRNRFRVGHHLQRLRRVPDVHAEPDDLRLVAQDSSRRHRWVAG